MHNYKTCLALLACVSNLIVKGFMETCQLWVKRDGRCRERVYSPFEMARNIDTQIRGKPKIIAKQI